APTPVFVSADERIFRQRSTVLAATVRERGRVLGPARRDQQSDEHEREKSAEGLRREGPHSSHQAEVRSKRQCAFLRFSQNADSTSFPVRGLALGSTEGSRFMGAGRRAEPGGVHPPCF